MAALKRPQTRGHERRNRIFYLMDSEAEAGNKNRHSLEFQSHARLLFLVILVLWFLSTLHTILAEYSSLYLLYNLVYFTRNV